MAVYRPPQRGVILGDYIKARDSEVKEVKDVVISSQPEFITLLLAREQQSLPRASWISI
jgi:hypothetical protein